MDILGFHLISKKPVINIQHIVPATDRQNNNTLDAIYFYRFILRLYHKRLVDIFNDLLRSMTAGLTRSIPA
jgi:hypothetical protein